jgi:hypothetical protein
MKKSLKIIFSIWLFIWSLIIPTVLYSAGDSNNMTSAPCGATGTNPCSDFVTKGPWVDVRAFGAIGGSTLDNLAIHNAASAIPASGGTLYIPDTLLGFSLTTPLIFTNVTGLHIAGNALGFSGGGFHSGSTLIAGTGMSGPMIYFNGARHVTIDNLVLDCADRSGVNGLKIDFDNVQSSQTSGDHYDKLAVLNCSQTGSIGVDIGNTNDYAASEQFFSHSEILYNDTGFRIQGGNTLNIHFENGSIAGKSQTTSTCVNMVKGDFWGSDLDMSNCNIGFNVSLNIDGLRITNFRSEAVNQLVETATGAVYANRTQIELLNVRSICGSTANYIDVNANFWLTFAGYINGNCHINYNPQATQISNGLNQFIDMGAYHDMDSTVTSGARWIKFSNFGNDAYKFLGAPISIDNQIQSTLGTGTAPLSVASITPVPNLGVQNVWGPTNQLLFTTTASVFSTSGFGPGASITSSNGSAVFALTTGTGNTWNSGTVTMPAAANGWFCEVVDQTTISTTNNLTKQTANSTNSVTVASFSDISVAGAWTGGDVLLFNCHAY